MDGEQQITLTPVLLQTKSLTSKSIVSQRLIHVVNKEDLSEIGNYGVDYIKRNFISIITLP